jgi:hypothetical protein
MHVPGLGIERVATGGPPESKPHWKPENYLEESLKVAKQIEKICSKDKILSYIVLLPVAILLCMYILLFGQWP